MNLSSYAKRLRISYNSAWSMWRRGQLPGYQLPTGTVIIDPPAFRSTPVCTVAVYARVSSSENKDNLERQAERLISWCNAQGWGVSKVVKECGSGINDQPLGLLIPRSDRWWWSTRIEPPALEWPPSRCCSRGLGRELVMVDTADTAEDDLMGDVVAIVTSFCARLYSRRRAKRKTEHVLAALQQNGSSGESEARESH